MKQNFIVRCTPRLRLVAATVHHHRAELEQREQLGTLLGCRIPDDWPPGEYDEHAQRFMLERMTEGGDSVIGWYNWYVIEKKDSLLVAAGGFFGSADQNGNVEIGYSVVASQRQRGIAKELVGELIRFAFSHSHVRRIIAHTLPANIASCRVLESLGFIQTLKIQDDSQREYELRRSE